MFIYNVDGYFKAWYDLQQVASLGEGANFDAKHLKRFGFLVFTIAFFIKEKCFSQTLR